MAVGVWVAVDSAEVAVMLMELVVRRHAALVAADPVAVDPVAVDPVAVALVAAGPVAAGPVAVGPVMASALSEHHVLHVTIKRCDSD